MSLPACHDCGLPSHGFLCSTCLRRAEGKPAPAPHRGPRQRVIHWAPESTAIRLVRAKTACGIVSLATDDFGKVTCPTCAGRPAR